MMTLEIIAFVLSGSSIILALVAMGLAITFYFKSSEIAVDIKTSVKKLEDIQNNMMSQLVETLTERQGLFYRHEEARDFYEIEDIEARETTLRSLIIQTLNEETVYGYGYIYNKQEYAASATRLFALIGQRVPFKINWNDFADIIRKLEEENKIELSTLGIVKYSTGIRRKE